MTTTEYVIDRYRANGSTGRIVVRFHENGDIEIRGQYGRADAWEDDIEDGVRVDSEAWGRLIALYNGKLQREKSAAEAIALAYRTRLDGLRASIHAIGGQLGGQDETEGVIDSEGRWHDLDDLGGDSDVAVLDRVERKIAELEVAHAAKATDRFTFCPGCDSRIVPGQEVVGVPADDGSETGDSELWHVGCRKTWEYDQGLAKTMSGEAKS